MRRQRFAKSNPLALTSHFDRTLKIARSIAKRHDPTSRELLTARKMAGNGANIREIVDALGWKIDEGSARRKLQRYSIRVRIKDRAHWGEETSLPYEGVIQLVNQRMMRELYRKKEA